MTPSTPVGGEMDDYAINRRLAEIAGVEVRDDGERREGIEGGLLVGMSTWDDYWSPLTDWSQLGELIERFPFDVHRYPVHGDGELFAIVDVHTIDGSRGKGRAGDHDLKRALCMAILTAHEEARDA